MKKKLLFVCFVISILIISVASLSYMYLKSEAKLGANQLAEMKVYDLVTTGYFSHTNQDGTTFDQRTHLTGKYGTFGEVLGYGYCDEQRNMDAWMKSPTHRAVITDKSYVGYSEKVVSLKSITDEQKQYGENYCYFVREYYKVF